jgi:two-component system, chemotaxis family, chemotaxis protein CheY
LSIKFLVVDDSKVMRQMIIQSIFKGGVFKPENCVIVEAADGAEGLAMFKSESPNVVLSDWTMPNMDGYAMIKEIRKLNKKIPIVMISEESTSERIELATSGGLATAYVVKPLTPGILEEKLIKAFGL